jgi:hypothetical protein
MDGWAEEAVRRYLMHVQTGRTYGRLIAPQPLAAAG